MHAQCNHGSCFIVSCINTQSRVSAEKKDYYESKLMLHWSYICTFAGCFLGWVIFAAIVIFSLAMIIIVLSAK